MSKFVSIFVLLILLSETICFVKITPIEDNFIITSEAKVRDVFNSILETLLLLPAIEQDLQKYLTIHNHLLAITLQSYEVIQEIVKLTQVDKDNVSKYLDISTDNDELYEHTILKTIRAFLVDLSNYKSVYGKQVVLDALVQNEAVLDETGLIHEYEGMEESSEIEDGNEFWVPKTMIQSSRRIYQGESARIKLFPFMAVVLVFKQFYCAGTIIHSDLIITAASCLQIAWNNQVLRQNPNFLAVRVGSSYYTAGGEVIPVRQIYFHPTFNPQTLKDNICLLRLIKHLNLNAPNQKIKKVDFDRVNSTLLPSKNAVTIIGWGAKNHASTFLTLVEPLAFDRLDVYSLGDCQDIYSKVFVSEQNFCAGYVIKGGGACNHDVGAPGIVKGVLTGIVTFGSPVCGTPDAPTVFTKIGYYAGWIEEIMEEQNQSKVITAKVTTQNTEHRENRAKHKNKEVDLEDHSDDDAIYLSFVRALETKDLMKVFYAKSRNSSEESVDTDSTETQDMDIEMKRQQILSLLKNLAQSPKKNKKNKHLKKHETKIKNRSKKKVSNNSTSTTVTYSIDESSSDSKEFMDLLKGKLLGSIKPKTGKNKQHKKPKKLKPSNKTAFSSKKTERHNKPKKSRSTTPKVTAHTRHDLLTKEITYFMIKDLPSTEPIPEPLKFKGKIIKTKTVDFSDYSDMGDSISGTPKLHKNVMKKKSVTTTTLQPKSTQKNTKSQEHHEVPVSFDYYEQYYRPKKKKQNIKNKKSEIHTQNKTDDSESETEDDSSEDYDEDKPQNALKPVRLAVANDVDNILKYFPNNFTSTSSLSEFIQSMYYNGDPKDSSFRAETHTSNDTELSFSLTLKDKDDDLRKSKGSIIEPIRRWLGKALELNGSNRSLYNKSDNEIYELLKLAIPEF